MIVDFAVAEQGEQAFDFFVADRAPETDAVDVVDRNEHGRFVGHHPQMIEPAGGAQDGFGFDALNDAESVIWVNDLVTNLECHMSPTDPSSPARLALMDCVSSRPSSWSRCIHS